MIVIISGLYQGEVSILLPLTSVHSTPCSPCSPWWISISALHCAPQGYLSFCKRKRWNQITQLVPGAHFLVARDVLARMWVYNRINIFIYCLFLYLFV